MTRCFQLIFDVWKSRCTVESIAHYYDLATCFFGVFSPLVFAVSKGVSFEAASKKIGHQVLPIKDSRSS